MTYQVSLNSCFINKNIESTAKIIEGCISLTKMEGI